MNRYKLTPCNDGHFSLFHITIWGVHFFVKDEANTCLILSFQYHSTVLESSAFLSYVRYSPLIESWYELWSYFRKSGLIFIHLIALTSWWFQDSCTLGFLWGVFFLSLQTTSFCDLESEARRPVDSLGRNRCNKGHSSSSHIWREYPLTLIRGKCTEIREKYAEWTRS